MNEKLEPVGKTLEDLKLCPSCYLRNRAWSLYETCPFCGAKGKSFPKILGSDWLKELVKMLKVTGTPLGAENRWGKEALRRLRVCVSTHTNSKGDTEEPQEKNPPSCPCSENSDG